MPILDYNLDQVPDLKPVPGNMEYQLEVVKVDEAKESRSNPENSYLPMVLKICNDDSAQLVFHRLMLPNGLDSVSDDQRKRMIKDFVIAMGLDPVGSLDTDLWIGKMVWAMLTLEEQEGYPTRNAIKRFIRRG